MSERIPTQATLTAVALVTGIALALQVVLTRLFSAVLAYHFSFLAVSLALLGTGSGALLLYVRPAWFASPNVERTLARLALALSASLVVVPLVLVRLDFTYTDETFTYEGAISTSFMLHFATACLVAAVPSTLAGIVVALALDRYAARIGSVYAYDLVGAGIGALAIVPVLWLASAPVLIAALGVVAALAAAMFAGPATIDRRAATAAAVASAAIVVAGQTTPLLYLPHRYQMPAEAVEVADRWNPLARVLGFEIPGGKFSMLFYDRVYAPVPNVQGDDLPNWRYLRTGPQSIGFEIAKPDRALVIGGGGGRDIYTALSQDVRQVDVIELNGGIQRVVDEDLGDVSQSPYTRPRVSTTIGDGRSVLAARDTSYDQIHIGFTDTLSANAAQGFALTENNLYTLEAFGEYLDHLAPGGVLNVSRPLKLVGDEALRVTVLMLAALQARGVEHPERNVVVVLGKDILGPPTGTILARGEPYAEVELARIRALADERGKGLAFAPGGPYHGDFERLAKAPDFRTFCIEHPLDVCPPTDDKPFFFNMERIGQFWSGDAGYHYSVGPMPMLLLTVAVLAVLSLVAIVLPMVLVRDASPPGMSDLAYFAALGVGFLTLEIALIQRFVLFLGYPTYALSVVICALLVFSGVGSLLSGRLAPMRSVLSLVLTICVGLTLAAAFALQPLLGLFMDLPLAARIVTSLLLLAPLGVALGMAMPLGLRRLRALHPRAIPFAWGVNGVTSVLASAFGIAVAINFGYTVTTLVACACYAFALMHSLVGRWSPGAQPTRS